MDNFTFTPLRKPLFSSLFLLLATFSFAQNGSQCYKPFSGVNKVPSAVQGGLICPGCATSNNLSNLVDGDINNFVEISQFVGLVAGSGVSVRDTVSDSPAGYYAGYVLGISPTLLTATVLNAFTISTYNNGVLQQSVSGASLLHSPVTGNGLPERTYLYFQTSTAFDEVRLTYTSLVGLLTSVDVYYAMAFDPNCGNNENNAICADAIQGPGTFVTNTNSIVCALCTLINGNNIVDADKDNYAVLSTPAGVFATSRVGVLDEQNIYPAGYRAGFIISPDQAATILDANLLNSITIETYLFGQLQEQQSFNAGGGGLVELAQLSTGNIQRVKLGFVTTQKFNEVRLRVNQPAGVSLGGLRIYGAFEEPASCTDCQNPLISTAPSPFTGAIVPGAGWTGVFGLGLHSLTNTGNVVDGDLNNFATYSSVLGLLSGMDLTVENNGPTFAAGTFGGFVIEREGSLLNVNLLPAITVTLYNGTTLVNSQSGVALLPAGVLTTSTGRTVVGVKSTAPFNRIKITFNNGLIQAGLEGNYRIYYAFVQLDSDNDGTPDCIDNCPGGNNSLDNDGDGIPDACDNCNVGTAAPAPGADTFKGTCLVNSVNLTGVTTNNLPPGAQLTFHTGTPATTANKLASITAVSPGTYYAAFFDPVGNCYSITKTITITPGTCAALNPIAEADHTVTLKNTAVSGSLKTNDSDPQGSVLTYNTTPTIAPLNGMVTIASNGNFTYTPNANFVGVDSFQYTVCNALALCSSAWAYASVTNPRTTGGPNNAPLAQSDFSQTLMGVAGTGNAAANDIDPDGNVLTYTLINNLTNGNLILSGTGTYTYTPNGGFTGNDTARYQVCDNGIPSKCDTALIVVSVMADPNGPANNAPFTQDDINSTPAGSPLSGSVLNNDSDPNGDPLTVSAAGALPTGLTLNSNGTYNYIPPAGFTGTVSVVYRACDAGGLCDTATLSIVVLPLLLNPDYTPSNDIDVLTFPTAGTPRDFIVNISEILNQPNIGQVIFRIRKLSAFTITYNPAATTANVFGGRPVANSDWLFTEDANFITVTLKPGVTINGFGTSSVGFTVTRNAGVPFNTTQNITATIQTGSGGDNNGLNNVSVTSITAN